MRSRADHSRWGPAWRASGGSVHSAEAPRSTRPSTSPASFFHPVTISEVRASVVAMRPPGLTARITEARPLPGARATVHTTRSYAPGTYSVASAVTIRGW